VPATANTKLHKMCSVRGIVMAPNSIKTKSQGKTNPASRQTVRLQVIAELAQESAHLSELEHILQKAANLICQNLGHRYAGLYLTDEQSTHAVLKTEVRQANSQPEQREARLKVGAQGLVGFVTATGKFRTTENGLEVALPLTAGQRVIGALNVLSAEPGAFEEDEICTLQIIANQLAVAVDNARLLEAARRQFDELITLHGVAEVAASAANETQLVSQTNEIIAATLVSKNIKIHLNEDKTTKSSATPASAGSLISAVQSELSVPIKIDQTLIGAVRMKNTSDLGYDPTDERMAETLSRQLATAIQKIRSFDALQRRVSELAALREVGLSLNASLDLKKVLEAILQSTMDIVHCSAAQIYLCAGEELLSGMTVQRNRPAQELSEPKADSLTTSVIATWKPQIIHTSSERPLYVGRSLVAAAIGIPLLHSGDLWGVLNLSFKHESPSFVEADLGILWLLADQAAAALVNGRLFAEAQERGEILAQALKQRDELVQLRSEFVQNVSHELRTPLSIIRGYAELLETAQLGDLNPEQLQAVNILNRRVQMLTRMVDDLVTILESETVDSRREEINLTDLAQRAVTEFSPNAQRSNLRLNGDIPQEKLVVRGTPGHLNRVLDNLIGNAIKFSPGEGEIRLRLARSSENKPECILEVSDQGIGIPTEKLERIFERFYQVDGSTKRRFGGTGLGLALVKEIVVAHGGRVYAESEVGKGSKFTVILPIIDNKPAVI